MGRKDETPRVVLEKAESQIAASTKNSAHAAGTVVVIDMEIPATSFVHQGATADRAQHFLALNH